MLYECIQERTHLAMLLRRTETLTSVPETNSSSGTSSNGSSAPALKPPEPWALSHYSQQCLIGDWQHTVDPSLRQAVMLRTQNIMEAVTSGVQEERRAVCRTLLPKLVQSFEEALFRTSSSCEAYSDAGTLPDRVLYVAQSYSLALQTALDAEKRVRAQSSRKRKSSQSPAQRSSSSSSSSSSSRAQAASAADDADELDDDEQSDTDSDSSGEAAQPWNFYKGGKHSTGSIVRLLPDEPGGEQFWRLVGYRMTAAGPQWRAECQVGHELQHKILTEEQVTVGIKAAQVARALVEHRAAAAAAATAAAATAATDNTATAGGVSDAPVTAAPATAAPATAARAGAAGAVNAANSADAERSKQCEAPESTADKVSDHAVAGKQAGSSSSGVQYSTAAEPEADAMDTQGETGEHAKYSHKHTTRAFTLSIVNMHTAQCATVTG
jgi:hypothetical protein